MKILEVKDLRKIYGKGETLVKALDGVSFSVEKGEFLAVVGTSGSGKSTLLHMMGGLDIPTGGKVLIDGKDLSSMKEEELTIFRRRNIGFVFQSYNLVPMLNVMENITLPLGLDGKKPDREYLENVIGMLGLEKKKALAAKPAILLADEPTGNLDSRTSQDVLSLLRITCQQFHQTMVMITHNEEIAQTADRILRIEDGKLVKGSDDYGIGE